MTNTIFLSLSILLKVIHCQEEPVIIPEPTKIVNTESGPVRGLKINKYGMELYGFLGIPFAEPPVGKLRFKPPLPITPWSDVLEANKNGPQCLQVSSEFLPSEQSAPEMSEDCLTLNVFTNNIGSEGLFRKKPQAVMVWIHGGGFTIGSKDLYRMDELLKEDVVYVAMNYRLAALGFMSFGNDIVSGNMGLKDQQLAIQWVRYNIHHFGGDPNRITIFGESAGAISVQAQVLSPWNNGLLKGAIAQSGSILNLHFEPEGEPLKYARNAVTALGCPRTFDQTALECLQRVDIEKMLPNITDSDEVSYDPSAEPKFYFWPTVDKYATNPFIPMDPLEALKTGMFNRIPYMSGTCTYEGALITGPLGFSGIKGADTLDVIEIPAKTAFSINYGKGKTFNKVTQMFYNHTSGNSRFEQEKPAMNFFTDTMFLSPEQKSVELMSGYVKNVYNYLFSQPTNNSWFIEDFGLTTDYTPMHADDLIFMISSEELAKDYPELVEDFSDDEQATSDHMIKYWTNFAKYGNPTGSGEDSYEPAWNAVTPKEKNYMEINAKPEMKKDLFIERMFFWDKMLWEEEERMVEKKQLYYKTTQFLMQGYKLV